MAPPMADRRIGVDLGGTKIEAVALAPDGTIVRRERRPTPRDDYAATLDTVAELVQAVGGDAGRCTVGIGTPGAISPATGRMKNANSTWLNDQPLAEDLTRRLRRPIRLANDADCFTLSEAKDGAAQGAASVFGVILGTGVGGGVVVNGAIVRGPNAIAGEWGHNALPWPQPDELAGSDCYCGKRGCIETWLSGPALARDHEASCSERVTPESVAQRAATGEPTAVASLARYTSRLARALASVINVLDPHSIVLGGGLSNLDILYEQVPAQWVDHVFSDRVDTQLLRPRYGDSSGVRGAAWLWDA